MICEATLTTIYPIRLPDGSIEENTIQDGCVIDHSESKAPHHQTALAARWSGRTHHKACLPVPRIRRFTYAGGTRQEIFDAKG